MGAGIWFWLIYVICLVFGFMWTWPADWNAPGAHRPLGINLIVFVLLGLLGWGIFGSPIK